MSIKSDHIEKKYFTLKEAAKLLNKDKETVRGWSKKIFPKKHKGHRRLLKYTNTDITIMREIYTTKHAVRKVHQHNPDNLFDGFDDLVDIQSRLER